jgi:hypothetical protein
LPTPVLIALPADEDARVTQPAAASPTLPEAEMERLLSAARHQSGTGSRGRGRGGGAAYRMIVGVTTTLAGQR